MGYFNIWGELPFRKVHRGFMMYYALTNHIYLYFVRIPLYFVIHIIHTLNPEYLHFWKYKFKYHFAEKMRVCMLLDAKCFVPKWFKILWMFKFSIKCNYKCKYVNRNMFQQKTICLKILVKSNIHLTFTKIHLRAIACICCCNF